MERAKKYTLQQIADHHGYGAMQTSRHIEQLVIDKKFEKKSFGKFYTQEEFEILSKLLGFPLPQIKKTA